MPLDALLLDALLLDALLLDVLPLDALLLDTLLLDELAAADALAVDDADELPDALAELPPCAGLACAAGIAESEDAPQETVRIAAASIPAERETMRGTLSSLRREWPSRTCSAASDMPVAQVQRAIIDVSDV